MHKKTKIKGHVAHKMAVGDRIYFYIVAPERESVEVYAEWDQYPIGYVLVESIRITPRMVGRHGYLQSIIKRLNEYLSGDLDLVADYSQNDADVPPWSTKYDVLFDSKEEKKMRKKTKVNGHVLHKLPECDNLYYTVEPENGRIGVHKLIYDYVDWGNYKPHYYEYGCMNIDAKRLGRPGYLAAQVSYLARKYSGNTTREILSRIADKLWKLEKTLKEEDKMGEIRKDRITLDEPEGCCLELFKESNTIVFHFGTESRVVTVPDDYEINYGVKEPGTCDLHIQKKKPSLLNGTLHFDACVERQGRRYSYARYPGDLNSIIDVINGRISKKEVPYRYSNSEILTKTYYHASDLLDDFRKLYNDRIIFPNASSLDITFTPDREKI